FIWLFFPITVLFQRAAFDPRETARTATRWALGVAFGLMILALPVFPKYFQAIGNNLAATFVLIAALAWHIHHPPEATSLDSAVPAGKV
ncbi:MAG: hypothetical protein JSS22_04020, partial [Proteobacteria bacterium]|nr:hypothetical protein [Pseudomonadota bacterium]